MAGRPPLTDAPTFGRRLAAARKAKGWTQPRLARELGITLAALTHYERKAGNPSADFVTKVAKLFNVTVDELLGVESTFGTQLIALRKTKSWTQPQLARELGISVALLTHYEKNTEKPSAEFAAKVAKLFNVPVNKLLIVPEKPGPPSQIEERLTAIRDLPRDKQKVVLQLLDSFLQTSGASNGHSKAA